MRKDSLWFRSSKKGARGAGREWGHESTVEEEQEHDEEEEET